MRPGGSLFARLLCALLVSGFLFVLTGFLLAPEGSRRGVDMEAIPSATAATEAPAASAPPASPEASPTYIGNKNTLVFHLPSCSSLSRTAEENRLPFATRQEALDAGCAPCGRCHP